MNTKKLETNARKIFAFKKQHQAKKEHNTKEYQKWKESVTEANRKKHADTETAKRIAEGNRNRKERLGPKYSKRVSEGQRRRYENMSEEERREMSNRRKEVWADSDYRESMMTYYHSAEYTDYITNRNRELAKDPEWREKVAKNNKAKRSDPGHLEKHQAGVANRSNNNEEWIRKNCRPVSTPYGIFQKAKDVMDLYHLENGGNRESVAVKLRNWLKSDKKPEWKYLTWEEYDEYKKTA
jgi:hypothetical protein